MSVWRHPFRRLSAYLDRRSRQLDGIRRLLAYLDRRSRQQQAIRVMVNAGSLRSADHGIRYAMTQKELADLLFTAPTEDRVP